MAREKGVCRLERIVTLYEEELAASVTLSPELAAVYDGDLHVPDTLPAGRPYVLVNFVESLDGVTAYSDPNHPGGGAISGESEADHFVMGLLRARADAVIFGAGSLRGDSGHVWTPAFISPSFSVAFDALRARLGKTERYPLSVVVSASGAVDLREPTFSHPGLRALIATTEAGAEQLAQHTLPAATTVRALPTTPTGGVDPAALLELLAREYDVRVALHEGGPLLLGAFLGAGLVDELFLSLAPRLVGRAEGMVRRALVEGQAFAPGATPEATLVSIRRTASLLLLRYRFTHGEGAALG